MKFTKITAAVLSITALAAMPCIPEVANVLPDYSISASAISMPDGYVTVNGGSYAIQTEDNGTQVATLISLSSSVTSLDVPATVTFKNKAIPVKRINGSTCEGNTTLRTVSLTRATNLVEIGDSAFRGTRLTSCVIGSSSSSKTITIADHAFEGSTLQNLTFNCKGVVIKSTSFAGCNSLRSMVFNSSVTSINIGASAFSNKMSLNDVAIVSSSANVVLGKDAFSNCALRTFKVDPKITLTKIPEGCFRYCNLTSFVIPASTKTIEKEAFYGATMLSSVSLSKNLTSVSPTAFGNVKGVSSFTVASGNTAVKAVNGVLYSADGNTLYCYPSEKKDTTYNCPATYIAANALQNNPYLKTLYLQKYKYDANTIGTILYFENLESLYVSTTEYNLSAATFMSHWGDLVKYNKIQKINGNSLLYTPANKEPYFNSKFSAYINANFEQFDQAAFMKQYVDKMAEYVVNTTTNSGMSDLQKAVKIHKWIMDRVTYDTQDVDNKKNHVDASVFLHKKGSQYYTVCEGYARIYRILMNKAGVQTIAVSGNDHAWNMIKLAGKWYHVDCCWDDQIYDDPNANRSQAGYYTYFLCTDAQFKGNHKDYSPWYVDFESMSVPVANTNIERLGDANQDGRYQLNDVDKIQSLEGKTVGTSQQLINADMDLDGKITGDDTYLRYGAHYYNPNGLTPRLIVFTHLE